MKLGLMIVDHNAGRSTNLKNIFEAVGGGDLSVVVKGKDCATGDRDAWDRCPQKLTIAHATNVVDEKVDVFYTSSFVQPLKAGQVWIWRDLREKELITEGEAKAILKWVSADGKNWDLRPSVLRPLSGQPLLAAIAVLSQAALRAERNQLASVLRSRQEWSRLLFGAGGDAESFVIRLGSEWPEDAVGSEKWQRLRRFVLDLAKNEGDDKLGEPQFRSVLRLAQWGLK